MPPGSMERLSTQIRKMHCLNALNLTSAEDYAEDFAPLAGHSSLRQITCTVNLYTPEFVEMLSSMPLLEKVQILRPSGGSDIDIVIRQQLQKAHPSLQVTFIDFEWGC